MFVTIVQVLNPRGFLLGVEQHLKYECKTHVTLSVKPPAALKRNRKLIVSEAIQALQV